jgi:hypothetical protein
MYYVCCMMTGLYSRSCLYIYVLWHVLHPVASFSQKCSMELSIYEWMNEWMKVIQSVKLNNFHKFRNLSLGNIFLWETLQTKHYSEELITSTVPLHIQCILLCIYILLSLGLLAWGSLPLEECNQVIAVWT